MNSKCVRFVSCRSLLKLEFFNFLSFCESVINFLLILNCLKLISVTFLLNLLNSWLLKASRCRQNFVFCFIWRKRTCTSVWHVCHRSLNCLIYFFLRICAAKNQRWLLELRKVSCRNRVIKVGVFLLDLVVLLLLLNYANPFRTLSITLSTKLRLRPLTIHLIWLLILRIRLWSFCRPLLIFRGILSSKSIFILYKRVLTTFSAVITLFKSHDKI